MAGPSVSLTERFHRRFPVPAFRTAILQAATPDHLRGRLQGVFIVVGDLLAGGATKIFNEGWVLWSWCPGDGGVECTSITTA